MKVLFIGGTGLISSACVELAVARGMDVVLLNRGNAPAFSPFIGCNVFGGLSIRYVFGGSLLSGRCRPWP